MIASLRGKVTYKTSELRKDAYIVLDVAGVGYKVFLPGSNLRRVAEESEVIVYTYLSVSETAMNLYGFLNPADKTFFTLLLDVPGIGPKTAMGILEKTTMAEVQQAILEDNASSLIKVSGLSQKIAEKIVLALKDKVESLTVRDKTKPDGMVMNSDMDVFDALVSFGYSTTEVKQAIGNIDKSITDTALRIREALKILGKK
ncbi:MAG: Holliday junction branch migration protein RuvA [Patescibacteria group bacterium]|nr:Holliday junction branch migration protein RuvA [Patescibacteria group bacterium]